MGDESDNKSPEQPPQQPPVQQPQQAPTPPRPEPDKPRTKGEWVKLVWDLTWDWRKIKEQIEKEYHHAIRFPLLLFCLFAFGALGAWGITSHFAATNLTKVIGNYDMTNNAQLKQIDTINGEWQEAKRDRDKYQLMVAPFEAAALKLNTNAPVEERLHLFSDQMLTISTNFFAAIEADKPVLELYVNGKAIPTTNDTIINLKHSRNLNLGARNVSSVTADHITFDFTTPLALNVTNVTVGPNWLGEPSDVSTDGDDLSTNITGSHWMYMCTVNAHSGLLIAASPIEINTNLAYPVVVVTVNISATRSDSKSYKLSLEF